MKILYVSSEAFPFCKTGGLADVAGSLPPALARNGDEVAVILPLYGQIGWQWRQQMTFRRYIYVDLGWRHQYCGLFSLEKDGVTWYFVDNEHYFCRNTLYGEFDDGERFAFFCKAVIDLLPSLDWMPDILHCNDWHTAMLPMLLRTQYGYYVHGRIKTLLTIHNILYQGKFSFDFFRDLLRVEDRYFTSEFMEINGCASFLKAGCVFADRLSTVSPSYADELCTPYYGEGMEGILSARRHQLSGILNGIDKKVFNPYSDQLIPKRYDKGHLKGKQTCKESLMFDMGLQADPHTPLIAMVSRMTDQKGFDLVERMLDEMMELDICFLLLGSGDKQYENFMQDAERRHRGRVCAYIGYNEELSHRVYAGADMLLMPSKFEPCGLSQMIAMRYGTLPIVRETGGLRDSVVPYNQFTGEGTGFTFANYNAHEMKATIERALSVYRDEPETWNKLVRNAMAADFGFERSAEGYARLYIDLL